MRAIISIIQVEWIVFNCRGQNVFNISKAFSHSPNHNPHTRPSTRTLFHATRRIAAIWIVEYLRINKPSIIYMWCVIIILPAFFTSFSLRIFAQKKHKYADLKLPSFSIHCYTEFNIAECIRWAFHKTTAARRKKKKRLARSTIYHGIFVALPRENKDHYKPPKH